MVEATAAATQVKIPLQFQLADELIDAATIRPATFSSFADCVSAAHKMTQPPAFSAKAAPGADGQAGRLAGVEGLGASLLASTPLGEEDVHQ